jgi:glycosyltransferase involved in cell wall biosynthesis
MGSAPDRAAMRAETRQQKRAFCLSRIWGSYHGGTVYSKRLLHELSSRGWAVTVLAERFEEPVSNGIVLKTFFNSSPAALILKLSELLAIFRLVDRNHETVFIVQGDLPRVSYLLLQCLAPLVFIRQDGILACPGNNRFLARSGSVCRRRFGCGCLSVHRAEDCLSGLSLLHRVGRVGYRMRDRILLRGLQHFLVNSNYLQRAHGRPARVLYPPRLDTAGVPKEITRDLKRLIFCGRLEPVKGALQAIKILQLLPSDYHLDVLGDGSERARLMRFAEDSCLRHRVTFHGWVNEVTRDNALRSAGVTVVPSLCDEAFGMVGLESFAQGTPVVAYDVGGIPEWCRDGAGILVDSGNVRAAAAAVLRLTKNPPFWLTSSAAARRIVEEQFPVGRFGKDLAAVLAEVLATTATSV